MAVAIICLAIFAPHASADGSAGAPPDDVQDTVVPATSPPEKQDATTDTGAPAGGLADSKKGSWWAYRHIHIVNELSGGRAVTVHCRSKNNDMGVHVVPPGSEYQWRFRPNIFGITLFWCHVAKGNVEVVFDAYNEEEKDPWERIHMDNTYWVARDDAVYLRQFWKNNNMVLWRRWP
ncbi:unnamed protein product [Linum trigynum]|uniref:S-protein homolog n=1 Tax=Linum trigynum TaxID=586398 RepID=A0AAV2FZ66_9ROSI